MENSKGNYWVDAVMFLAGLVTAVTGLVMFFFLPGGTKLGPYREFLGVTKELWRDIHNWAGIVLVVLVIVHLIMHLGWITRMTKKVFSKK